MQYYNKISKGYDELYKEEQLKKISIIKKYIKPKGLLLDIGAGTGISTSEFTKKAFCIALDPSLDMLKKFPGVKICAKAEHLPFKDDTFDVIISVTALHHSNLKKAIAEIKRVAKPNSQIALSILKKSKKLPEIKKLLKDFKEIEEEKDIILIKNKI